MTGINGGIQVNKLVFSHGTVLLYQVIEVVKNGDIKHFFLVMDVMEPE